MALRAGNIRVAARQRVMGIQQVIECGIGPVGGRVARGAVTRQTELHVRRIIAVEVVGGVAGVALSGRAREDIIDVARGAGQGGVRTRKSVARVFQVVKLGVEPAVHAMTALARSGQAELHVIDDRREEVLLMAGVTGCGQAGELPHSGLLVALFALHQGMRSHQREAVLVVLNGLQRSLPTGHGMATCAVGAELPAMNVSVAVRALRTYILEDHAGMALAATHLRVHAT